MLLREKQFQCIQRSTSNLFLKERYCPEVWDGYLCWTAQNHSTASNQSCPHYVFGSTSYQQKSVIKNCEPTGTWLRHQISNQTWTNYTSCESRTNVQKELLSKLYLALVGFAVSAFVLLIALIIYSLFSSLQCQRVTIHKNLFSSYILNSIVASLFLLSIKSYNQSQVYCKFLNGFLQYTQVSNYFWMLCEGIHLHGVLIMAVFRTTQKTVTIFLLGWGFPLVPFGLYVIARFQLDDTYCWIDSNTPIYYVIHGPIYVALVMNFMMQCHLLKVLLEKLRIPGHIDLRIYMPAVRATLLLTCLLGTHHILLTCMSFASSPTFRNILIYIEVITNSLQGFVVAFIFCFLHEEVTQKLSHYMSNYCRRNSRNKQRNRGRSNPGGRTVWFDSGVDATQIQLVVDERTTCRSSNYAVYSTEKL